MATKKTVFIDGPVSPAFIAESISKHSSKTDIGGHSIFLGQIRADQKDGLEVTAIEYSTYREMAEEKLFEIREETFKNLISHACTSIIVWVKSDKVKFVFLYLPHQNTEKKP